MNELFTFSVLAQSSYGADARLSHIDVRALTGFEAVALPMEGSSGLRVQLFIKDEAYSLSIRGTDSFDDFWDLTKIAVGAAPSMLAQYQELSDWLSGLTEEGGLLHGKSFSVTGHSLGGYLAAALKADTQFSSQITDAYLYNAPGVSGLFGTFANAFQSMFGMAPTAEGVHNIVPSEGGSLVAGLGFEPAPPIVIQTAHQNSVLGQHSISSLTNALMVAETYTSKFMNSTRFTTRSISA